MSREVVVRSSVRRASKMSTGPISDASHALVDFDNEGAAIIRCGRIVKDSIYEGRCKVKWDDGQEYDGALIIAGTYKDCLMKQRQLEKEDSDEDDFVMEFNEVEVDAEKSTKIVKRKRKQIKADKNVNNKKKKLSDDKGIQDKKKNNRNKDTDGAKDDFILHVTKLLPIANGDKMGTVVEAENNLVDSARDVDGATTGLDGTTPTLSDTITGTYDTMVVDELMDSDSDSSSSIEEGEQTITKTIVVSDGIGGIHNFSGKDKSSDDFIMSLKELKGDLMELKSEVHQLDEMNNRLKGIEEQLKLVFTSGIAAALSTSQNSASVSIALNSLTAATKQPAIIQSSLTPPITPSVTPPVTPAVMPAITPSVTPPVTPAVMPAITPVTPAVMPAITPVTPAITPVTPAVMPAITPVTPAVMPAITPVTPAVMPAITLVTPSVMPAITPAVTPAVLPSSTAVNASTSGNVNEELIHPAVLCPILMKYKTRRSLASALVNELFDAETRMRSNVRGRGKDQLDPQRIQYVKKKCFQVYPSERDSEMKKIGMTA